MKRKRLKILLILLFTLCLTLLVESDVPKEAVSTPTLFASQNNADLAALIRSSIYRAKKSIYLQIFSLTDPSILKALQKQADMGIDVTVFYDKINGLKRPLPSSIHAFPIKMEGLMHRKILIIDDEEIWLGSANFTYSSLCMHDNLLLSFCSKECSQVIQENLFNVHDFQVDDQHLELWLLPESKKGEERLLQMIQSAQKTIKVAMFTWTNPKFTQAVIDAKNRDVSVEVVIDKNNNYSNRIIAELIKEGVCAKLSKKDVLLHHKFAYIDGKTLILGSANWTRSAFSKNRDCFMIVHDLREEQKACMEKVWQQISLEAA